MGAGGLVGSGAAYVLHEGFWEWKPQGLYSWWGRRGGSVCWATWVPRLPPLEVREARTELEDVTNGVPEEEPQPGPLHSVSRNASLERVLPGLRIPQAHRTGTTIAGLVFQVSRDLGLEGLEGLLGNRTGTEKAAPLPPQDGVILGADTRATSDSVVMDKNCEKIHFIAPKI